MVGGAHHDGSELYVSTGEPALGEAVTVLVRIPVAADVRRVYVRTTPDGEPKYAEATVDRRVTEGAAAEVWWRAQVGVRNPVTRYRFLLDGPAGQRWLTAAGTVWHEVPDATDFRLVAHAPPPSWAADAVIYEIFPDRFARSGAASGRAVPDWALPCDWATTPVMGSGPQTPYQFYGGDLDGVRERLDHIAALGANTLYLTPIFPARSNHRYDNAAYDTVDPLLGGDAALERLAGEVHRRGWRLIGDVTTNHTGDAHPWFTSAVCDVDAPERGLYYFGADGDYESWNGVKTLPKLDWTSAELRRRFTEGPGSVLARWLLPPYRLDGWRVDVANMTGRRGADDHTHEVAALLRRSVVAARPDALFVAEHAHDGTADLDVDGWHGSMNYYGFLRPVWSWLRADELELDHVMGVPGGVPRRAGPAALATMRAFAALVSWRAQAASWNLLGSHDTARPHTVIDDPARVAVAVGLLLTLPGTPMIFAGDELGLRGVNGEGSRTPMPWHTAAGWGAGPLPTYRALIALRHSRPALRRGGLRWLHVDDDTFVYSRQTREETLLVLARRAAGSPVRLAVAGRPGAAGAAHNVYGGAPELRPDAGGALTLPADGPTFQVWQVGPA